MIAQLKIDYELCQDPLNCRKCLSICPAVVFVCGPTKRWKGRETDAREYKIFGRYYDKCSGCGDCLRVCPKNAIHLAFLPKEELAEKFRRERLALLQGREGMGDDC